MSYVLTQLSIGQQFMESIDLSYHQVSNKISSRTLSQIIQSVKQTKNSYGGQVHPSIPEVSKIGNQVAALQRPFVIGKILIWVFSTYIGVVLQFYYVSQNMLQFIFLLFSLRRVHRNRQHVPLANTPADAANANCGPSRKSCTISWWIPI